MAVKIDSRRSWIVALASSLLLSCSVWTFRCAGLIYVAFTDELGVSAEDASWPIVIFSVASSVLGPAVGAASMHVSIPTLFIFSSCLGTLSVVLSSFARNIWEITLTLGLMQGICSAFPVTLTGVLVTRYFDRYQTSAIGVLLSGPAVVSMALTLAMQAIFHKFGLQWSLLLLSGLSAQAIPAALLIRMIGLPEEQNEPPHNGTIKKPKKAPTTTASDVYERASLEKGSSATEPAPGKTPAGRTDYTDHPGAKKVPEIVLRQLGRNRVRRDTPRIAEVNDDDALMSYVEEKVCGDDGPEKGSSQPNKPPSTIDLLRLKWFYALLGASVGFIYVNGTLLNLVVALARDKKVSSDVASNLITLLAFGDVMARMGSGWITDKGFVTREHLLLINYTLLSAVLIGLGMFSHPIVLCTLVTFTGWLLGSSVILFTNITRNRLGFPLLALSSGWYFFFAGILVFTRPPMIGYFQDTVGSFDPIMYLMAALLLVCTIIYVIILWSDHHEAPESAELDQWEPSEDEELGMHQMRDRATSYASSIASL